MLLPLTQFASVFQAHAVEAVHLLWSAGCPGGGALHFFFITMVVSGLLQSAFVMSFCIRLVMSVESDSDDSHTTATTTTALTLGKCWVIYQGVKVMTCKLCGCKSTDEVPYPCSEDYDPSTDLSQRRRPWLHYKICPGDLCSSIFIQLVFIQLVFIHIHPTCVHPACHCVTICVPCLCAMFLCFLAVFPCFVQSVNALGPKRV